MSPEVLQLLSWLDHSGDPVAQSELGAYLEVPLDALVALLGEAEAARAVVRFYPSATMPNAPIRTLPEPTWMITEEGRRFVEDDPSAGDGGWSVPDRTEP